MAECGWKPRTADSESTALFIAPQGRTKPEGPRKKAEDSLLSVSFPHRKRLDPMEPESGHQKIQVCLRRVYSWSLLSVRYLIIEF